MEYISYFEIKDRLTKSRIELSEARKSAAVSRVELAGELPPRMQAEWLSIRKQMAEISENGFRNSTTAEAFKACEEKMVRLIAETDNLIARNNHHSRTKA